MRIEKIDHIAIMVKDLKKAEEFFTDLFQTKFTSLGETKEMDIASVMNDIGIELTQPILPNGPSSRALEKRGEGLSMLSLKVTNLAEAMAHMESRGIQRIGYIQNEKMKVAVYHPKDIFGVMIELIEY
jgi:methylmalonyl-CoA epimerase